MPPAGMVEAFGHALAGATGTALSTATVYPLDLITTRLKVQRQLKKETNMPENRQYHGVFHAFEAIITHEGGISALYTGLAQDIFKSITDSFLFFLFYAYFREARRRTHGKKLPALEELAVGAAAGACARACTTPIANVVTRKQTSAMLDRRDRRESLSVWDILGTIRAENGARGLWAGYSASLLLTINPSITFFLNDKLGKVFLPNTDEASHTPQTTFLLAAASKAIATTISYPIQTAKARLQVSSDASLSRSTDSQQTLSDKPPQSPVSTNESSEIRKKIKNFVNDSVLALVISIARTEGVTALYAGLQGEMLKSFFSHGLTMVSKGIIHKLVIRLGIFLMMLGQSSSSSQKLQRFRQMFLRLL
ncbi:uncharacterized protein CTRU02_213490 [Colletotrichum truncatum]|uniref:Uncharacterized protein n=1 Tax=Colletotrichum truncatum TaxID=5467 RepID=A0ACC3YFW4_COLTU|nr:uncharacterized protein CTRU02_12545 [Colletotrichum truncatum]KAF6784555.1 hypothetical protein CTRU02_12545 [Colletotrichum truncatum]